MCGKRRAYAAARCTLISVTPGACSARWIVSIAPPPTSITMSALPATSSCSASSEPASMKVALSGVMPLAASSGSANVARAAARQADGDPATRELVEAPEARRVATKDPQRLVIEAREHHDPRIVLVGHDAALHERDVDARLRVEQQVVVVARAARLAQHEGHALARERLAIPLPVSVVEPRRRSGRQHERTRRDRLQQLERHPQRRGDRDREEEARPQQITAREQRIRVDGHGRPASWGALPRASIAPALPGSVSPRARARRSPGTPEPLPPNAARGRCGPAAPRPRAARRG